MNKNPQPDACLLRGALIAGCSQWKPILHPVCHATDGASLDKETVGHAAAAVEVQEEDPAVPFDFQSI